jgi:hypothetical protein
MCLVSDVEEQRVGTTNGTEAILMRISDPRRCWSRSQGLHGDGRGTTSLDR